MRRDASNDGITFGDLGTHMLLTTFRKTGVPVATPVWSVPLPDGRIAMWTGAGTGKWKRIRNNPHVTVQRCSARGHPDSHSTQYSGTAQIIPPGPEADRLRALIVARYGRLQIAIVRRISRLQGRYKPGQKFGDTIVVIAPITEGLPTQQRATTTNGGDGGN